MLGWKTCLASMGGYMSKGVIHVWNYQAVLRSIRLSSLSTTRHLLSKSSGTKGYDRLRATIELELNSTPRSALSCSSYLIAMAAGQLWLRCCQLRSWLERGRSTSPTVAIFHNLIFLSPLAVIFLSCHKPVEFKSYSSTIGLATSCWKKV